MLNFKDKNFKIVEKFKYFISISLVIMLIGLVMTCIPSLGMNVGVDFTGGTKIEVEVTANNLSNSDIIAKITDVVEKENGCKINGSVQASTTGSGTTTYEARLDYYLNGNSDVDQQEFIDFIQGDLSDDTNNGLCGKVETAVADMLPKEAEVAVKAYTVGATASSSLLKSAFGALALAIVLMLVYIFIRFKFASAIAAVLALLHDVLIMVALTVIFQIPVNSTFIAAIITIVGYSINATIVIFDRIRESLKFESAKLKSDEQIANEAISNTLTRSILTSLTTLVMVAFLAILGVSAIKEFIIPIIFGLIAGTYSSVFLASSFWVILRKAGRKIKNNRSGVKGGKQAVKGQ